MLLLVWVLVLAGPGRAQDFSGLARLDVAQSQVRDADGALVVDLYLSQPISFRVFTLDAPRRLVLDFREVDWRGATRAGLLNSDLASDLRFGALRPGWSRMVVDLVGPLLVETAGMTVNASDGTAHLVVRLRPGSDDAYTAATGAPPDPGWQDLIDIDPTAPTPPKAPDGPLIVVIDPGHGGIDPGAGRDGLSEAGLMLALGLEVAEAVNRAGGMRAVLTRDADLFVPLQTRMSIARANGADVFLSLHADALDEGVTSGLSVYTLDADGKDTASERMAERHDRGDLLAGVDLSAQDDTVATVLMDLARLETAPQSQHLADALVAGLRDAGASLNGTPRREAGLAVLTAADFPSVLIEVGFLSNDADRAALLTPQGRAPVVAGILAGLQNWAVNEAARAPLIRQ